MISTINSPGNQNLIIVMPIYEDSKSACTLLKELSLQFGNSLFVIGVDDGSIKDVTNITIFRDANINGTLIKLKRNVGHQLAIAIGLSYGLKNMREDQIIVVMDSDGEDTPSSIPFLLDTLNSPNIDIAVAERKSRIESLSFKTFYCIYKHLFRLLTGHSISFGNFMAFKHEAALRIVAMSELSIHLAGTVLISKLRIAKRPLDRGGRYMGKSKMNFISLVLHGIRALMIFAEHVLARVGFACALIATLSIVAGITTIACKLLGVAAPGWASVICGILILIFIQTGALSLITLMLTGIMRNVSTLSSPNYESLIRSVEKTSANNSHKD